MMNFENDIALFPDEYDPATESIGEAIKGILDRVWTKLRQFGTWLNECLKTIKGWGIELKKTMADKASNMKNAIADKASNMAGDGKALTLITKIEHNISSITNTLSSGLDSLKEKNADVTAIYSRFGEEHKIAAETLHMVRELPLLFMSYEIAKKAYQTMDTISNENSDMTKVVGQLKQAQEVASNDNAKILDKFINLHTKMVACTEALFKKLASYKFAGSKETNVYAKALKDLKESNRGKSKNERQHITDVYNSDKINNMEKEMLKTEIPEKKSAELVDILTDAGYSDPKVLATKYTKHLINEVNDSKEYKAIVKASNGNDELLKAGHNRLVYAKMTKKSILNWAQKYGKKTNDKEVKAAGESAIDEIIYQAIREQAYEDMLSEIEDATSGAFEDAGIFDDNTDDVFAD